jgi:hypothetical protein
MVPVFRISSDVPLLKSASLQSQDGSASSEDGGSDCEANAEVSIVSAVQWRSKSIIILSGLISASKFALRKPTLSML